MTCKDCIHHGVCENYFYFNDAEDTCENFKDNSKFIELPCKAGDKIWLIHSCCGSKWVENYNVLKVGITVEGIITDVGYDFKDIGKTVFLTKEEAEKALKERTQK